MACVSSLEPHCCWLDQALALVPEPQAVPGCPCPAVSSRSEPREVHTAAWGVTAAVHHLISPPTAWWAVPAERQLLKQAAVVAAQKLSACRGPRESGHVRQQGTVPGSKELFQPCTQTAATMLCNSSN